jgi:hypothetical protein
VFLKHITCLQFGNTDFFYIYFQIAIFVKTKKKKEKEKEKEKKVWFKTILKIYEIAVSNETLKG